MRIAAEKEDFPIVEIWKTMMEVLNASFA